MQKYKCLVIGLGKISMEYDKKIKLYLTHCKSIKKHPAFDLVGGVDYNLNKKNFFEKKFNSDFFSDIRTAIKKKNPNIIIIATSTNSHYIVFKEILKHSTPEIILFEKPITLDFKKTLEIARMAKNKNVKIFVNYNRISDISSESIKKILKISSSKKFKIFVHYSKGLQNSCSHFISLLMFWFGDLGKIKWKKKIRSIKKINDIDVDFELVSNRLRVIFNTTKYENFSHNSINIYGKDIKIEYMHNGTEIRYFKRYYDKEFFEYSLRLKKIIKNNFNKYQLNVYDNLYNYLINKKYRLFDVNEALKIEKLFSRLK